RRNGATRPGYVTAISGIGAEHAYAAAKRLVRDGATSLVSWGTAAALVPTLRPGALVLPTKILAPNGGTFDVDREWHARVNARIPLGMHVHTGAIVETAAPLLRAEDKRMLAQRFGADAADMESAALAALAREAGIPLLVVRAIVDGSALAIPARFAAGVRHDGSLRIASTVGALAVSPSQWPAALRLARGFRAALVTLQRIAHASHAE